MTDESNLRLATAELIAYTQRSPVDIVGAERDRVQAARTGTQLEIGRTNVELSDIDELIAQLGKARAKKARERDELIEQFASQTSALSDLETKVMRLNAHR